MNIFRFKKDDQNFRNNVALANSIILFIDSYLETQDTCLNSNCLLQIKNKLDKLKRHYREKERWFEFDTIDSSCEFGETNQMYIYQLHMLLNEYFSLLDILNESQASNFEFLIYSTHKNIYPQSILQVYCSGMSFFVHQS